MSPSWLPAWHLLTLFQVVDDGLLVGRACPWGTQAGLAELTPSFPHLPPAPVSVTQPAPLPMVYLHRCALHVLPPAAALREAVNHLGLTESGPVDVLDDSIDDAAVARAVADTVDVPLTGIRTSAGRGIPVTVYGTSPEGLARWPGGGTTVPPPHGVVVISATQVDAYLKDAEGRDAKLEQLAGHWADSDDEDMVCAIGALEGMGCVDNSRCRSPVGRCAHGRAGFELADVVPSSTAWLWKPTSVPRCSGGGSCGQMVPQSGATSTTPRRCAL